MNDWKLTHKYVKNFLFWHKYPHWLGIPQIKQYYSFEEFLSTWLYVYFIMKYRLTQFLYKNESMKSLYFRFLQQLYPSFPVRSSDV